MAGEHGRLIGWARTAVDRVRARSVTRTRARLERKSSGAGGRRGHVGLRRLGLTLAVLAVTLVGTGVALRLVGHVQQEVGPFSATFALQPSVSGGTKIASASRSPAPHPVYSGR